jgi:hypothetical protein
MLKKRLRQGKMGEGRGEVEYEKKLINQEGVSGYLSMRPKSGPNEEGATGLQKTVPGTPPAKMGVVPLSR